MFESVEKFESILMIYFDYFVFKVDGKELIIVSNGYDFSGKWKRV